MTSYTNSDMVKIELFPMLVKSEYFRLYCKNELSKYDTVNIIYYIENENVESQFQHNIECNPMAFDFV